MLPQATLASGSCSKWASNTASLIWSHILSEIMNQHNFKSIFLHKCFVGWCSYLDDLRRPTRWWTRMFHFRCCCLGSWFNQMPGWDNYITNWKKSKSKKIFFVYIWGQLSRINMNFSQIEAFLYRIETVQFSHVSFCLNCADSTLFNWMLIQHVR